MSVHEHREETPRPIRFGILTISDTRTLETDESGRLMMELIEAAGHRTAARALCKDDPGQVVDLVRDACANPEVEIVVLTGGTGLSRRDSTFEAVSELYQPLVPGFGELFRMLSFEEIGAASMLSRASAGIVDGKPVFSLPGSRAAVRLGMERLILPEAGHLLAQLAR